MNASPKRKAANRENVEINDNNVILMHVATKSPDAFLTDGDEDEMR